MTSIEHIDNDFLANAVNCNYIAFPESIISTSMIEDNALRNSSISEMQFLGIACSSLSSSIANTSCFGLNSNCSIYTSDDKKISYINSSNAIAISDYDVFEKSYVYEGKKDKLKLGRKIYFLRKELLDWCIYPENQNKSKFAQRTVPFVVIYCDFKTSSFSRNFLHNILENSTLQQKLKEKSSNMKFYIFLLDRHGDIDCTTNEDAYAFKQFINGAASTDEQNSKIYEIERNFTSVNFFYDGNFYTQHFSSNSIDDFIQLLVDGANNAKFSEFDPTTYDNVLDILDYETLPDSEASNSRIAQFHSSILEWVLSGTTPKTPNSWNIKSTPFDFDLIATPSTTYILVGAYDQNNPDNYPKQISNIAKALNEFSDNNVFIVNSNCHEVFTEKFKLSKNYRYFICYEFSHGNVNSISIGISKTEIWNVFKDMTTHQRVSMWFDSCHSGSMIVNASSSQLENDTMDYIIEKFQRRSELLTALFSTSISSTKYNPKLILMSSTGSNSYGWYEPRTSTLFQRAFDSSYAKTAHKDYDAFWEKQKEYGTADRTSKKNKGILYICNPERKIYPEDDNFNKNKIFI